MPKTKKLDQELIFGKLLRYLTQSGPSKAEDLCAWLGISQPAFSRLITQGRDTFLRIGRGRQTLYAVTKLGAWGKPKIPVCTIDEKGTLSLAATLYPMTPQGFYLESHSSTLSTRVYKNLPYFFEDLRPSGFLGRLVPHLYRDLGFPDDINAWTDDDCLLYLTRCGGDLIGNFIIGEMSEEKYIENMQKRMDVLPENDREKRYPALAQLVLSTGIPGSSAAGEQPKFLSIREDKGGPLPVIVKFSPPVGDAISRRVADLLVCEHIAHNVLSRHGQSSLRSCLVSGGGRLFLEMERFDRNRSGGRRGIISLRALDLEFVGHLKSWTDTAESLLHQKKIDQTTSKNIAWLETFGRLIGNTDRHHGNISLFCDGEKILGLAPVYDMLPMLYAPQQNQLVTKTFDPIPPKLFEMPLWNDAVPAACDFWSQVQEHQQISKEFKTMVADHESKLSNLSKRRAPQM